MELALIIGIFLTGFLLVFVEFFFIPGNTAVGLLGILIIVFGIYQVYDVYDAQTGSLVLGIILLLFISGVFYAAKTRAWEQFSHKDTLEGKMRHMDTEDEVVVDDVGEAISAIRPLGKAMIKEKIYEVRSYGDFIDAGSALKVVKVTPYKIYVEKVGVDKQNIDGGQGEVDL